MDVRTIMCCAGIVCMVLKGAADMQEDSTVLDNLDEMVVTGAKSGINRSNTTELTTIIDVLI